MIAIVDYGVGNLYSLSHSLKKIGVESVITNDKTVILAANAVILPGVGAFGDAMDKLKSFALDGVIKQLAERGTPLLGICLGMQMLFEKSYEYGEHEGLGLIKGKILPLKKFIDKKIPHMGWNSLKLYGDNPVFADISDGDFVYFVHSYFAQCEEGLCASTDYGIEVTAAVNKGNVYGTQFHPEKSGEVGLKILKAFAGLGGEKC